ncbi:MAG TPA: hypothetical protein VFE58_18235, partial [Tepidisphaeraceae bacterium]|nr:hypothetical protein [Tepidisphaeraceae bacterium]
NQLTIAGTLASQNLQVNANTTLLPGSSIQWQLVSATSSYFFSDTNLPWSQFSVNGPLTINPNASSNPILIIPQSVDAYGNLNTYIDFDPTQPYTFPFIQASSILNFNPADFAFDLSQFITPYTGTWSIQQSSPTELDLIYTPALPEPAALALLLCTIPLSIRPSRQPKTR